MELFNKNYFPLNEYSIRCLVPSELDLETVTDSEIKKSILDEIQMRIDRI